jgi:adenosine deaminase
MYSQKDLLLEVMTIPFSNLEVLDIMTKNDSCFSISEEDKRKDYKFQFSQIARIIQKKQTIYSLDELFLTFNKFFRQEHLRPDVTVPTEILYRHLKQIAHFFLSHREGKICIKYWESRDTDPNFLGPYKGLPKLTLWHSLSRMVSTDVLACLYIANRNRQNHSTTDCNNFKESIFDELTKTNSILRVESRNDVDELKGYYNYIELEDMQLKAILQKGLAETHMHASAGKHFYQTWEGLMNTNPNFENMKEVEVWRKNKPLISLNINIRKHICKTSIIRNLLILKLSSRCSFEEILVMLDREVNIDDKFKYDLGLEKSQDVFKKLFLEQDDCMLDEKETLKIRNWLYLYMMKSKEYISFKNFLEIDDDPVVKKYLDDSNQYYGIDTIGENIFLLKSFRLIEDYDCDEFKNERCLLLKYLFRYIAMKNIVYQEHVQQNQIKGLQNFKTYFATSTKTANPKTRNNELSKADVRRNKKSYWKQILKNQFQDTNLKKLELRISMGDSNIQKIQSGFCKDIEIILKSYLELKKEMCLKELPLIGLVIHFIKRDDDDTEKCWMYYKKDRGKYDKFLDHEKHRTLYAKQLLVLKNVLYKCEGLSKFVVGIDAASDENAAEPWVFAPIYDYARDSRDLLQTIERTNMNHLGFTFHVGEDFRHVVTGLRRIDEVIEHFRYHADDRIGHGIALGTDLKKWQKKHLVVVIPRIEYLEDLLWIWGIYKERKLVTGVDGFLERRIMQVANEIYDTMEGITVYELWKAYRGKFSETFIPSDFRATKDIEQCENVSSGKIDKGYRARLFCCETDERNAYCWNSEKLGLSYHCKVYRERMLEPISIATDEFNLDTLADIQSIVRRKISREGIIVETNPTSNRAIGEIDDIFEHYILDLKSKKFAETNEDNCVENNLIVTVNTDDPSVFQTSLSSEFAYIYYALLDKGYAKKDVLEWIEEVRKNGMSSSFIKDREPEEYIREVEELLHSIRDFIGEKGEIDGG